MTWKKLRASALALAIVLPVVCEAQTVEEVIAEAAPIESTIQGCYGHLSYYELSDAERGRIDMNSLKINNLLSRFARAHSLNAYEEVDMKYAMALIELNKSRPVVTCDVALIEHMEASTQAVVERFGHVKGPRER